MVCNSKGVVTPVVPSDFSAGDGIDISTANPAVISADINTTNLKFTATEINTIQDIATTSSPEFAGLTLTDFNGLLKTAGGIVSADADCNDIPIDTLGTPTYTNLCDYINTTNSAGVISFNGITDNGDGTVSVGAGTGYIRTTDSVTGAIKSFNWTANASVAIPTESTRWIYVDYNAGTPQIAITANHDDVTHTTQIILGVAIRENGTTHIHLNPEYISDAIVSITDRLYHTSPVQYDYRAGGLRLSETGTRNIALTTGVLWDKLNSFTIPALDTSVTGGFYSVYRDGVGGFTVTSGLTQWPNTLYDDGSGTLATLGNNQYAVLWWYAETDGDLIMVYGQGEYSSSAKAEEEAPPSSLPDRITIMGRLIGRSVFIKSGATFESISSAFDETFTPAGVTNHNNLAGLQGGTTGEYYHLTSTQHSDLTDGGNTTLHAHDIYILADGTRAFTGVVGGVTPTASTHLTTKDYVDNTVANLSWQTSVIDKDLTTSPVSPATGQRYIIAGTGGDWSAGTINDVAEYNGITWDFYTPIEGWTLWVTDENIWYVHNGSAWVDIGIGIEHGALLGLADDDHTQYANSTRLSNSTYADIGISGALTSATVTTTGNIDIGTGGTLNMGSLIGTRINVYSTSYKIGIAAATMWHDVPNTAKHEWRVNGVAYGYINASELSITGNILVSGTVDGVDVAALKTDVDGFPDELKNLATAEIQQLENISATTISATQWGYLGAFNQGLATTDSPTFAGLSLNGALSATGRITTDDATNATTTLDGSIQTDGGISAVQDLFIGGNGRIEGGTLYVGPSAGVPTSQLILEGTSVNDFTFKQVGSSYSSIDTLVSLYTNIDTNANQPGLFYQIGQDAAGSSGSGIIRFTKGATSGIDSTTNFYSTTDATSSTAASVMLAGGLAVAKKGYFGTDVNVGGGLDVTGSLTVSTDVTVTGNLTVNGTTFTANTETVEITDNLLLINNGEVGAGVTAGTAGIQVDRGTLTDYQFLFDEATDTFRVGEIGSLLALAAREDTPTDNGLAIWDSATSKFETDTNITWAGTTLTVAGTVSATTLGGTLSTAAQTNVTSLGTLTALDVDNININGNDITSTDLNGNINIHPNGAGSINLHDGAATLNSAGLLSSSTLYLQTRFGTASVPAIAPSVNSDTGIYFPNTGTEVGFTVDSALQGYFASDGLHVDNLNFNGNTIITTDTNGNLTLAPNGTGWTTTANLIKSTNTTDATAADTGSFQTAGGIYAAKNIVCDGEISNLGGHWLAQGGATLGLTNACLRFSSLPAYDSYYIQFRARFIDVAGGQVIYLRIGFDADTTAANYVSRTISSTGSGSSSSINGIYVCGATSSLGEFHNVIKVAGLGTASAGKNVDVGTNHMFGSSSNISMGGTYSGSAGQLSEMRFEIFDSAAGATRYTTADRCQIEVAIFGVNLSASDTTRTDGIIPTYT